jgi:hypothetical protein
MACNPRDAYPLRSVAPNASVGYIAEESEDGLGALEQSLLRDPHIEHYLPAEYSAFPNTDLARFTRPGYARSCIDGLQSILAQPYIIDDFTDHAKRREWRTALIDAHPGAEDVVSRFLKGNALCGNNANYLWRYIKDLKSLYAQPEDDEFSAAAQDAIAFGAPMAPYESNGVFHCPYDKAPIDERLAWVQEMKRKAYRVLETLSPKARVLEFSAAHVN